MAFSSVGTVAPSGASNIVVESTPVTGGTLFVTTVSDLAGMRGVSSTFAPLSTAPLTRYMALTAARSDTGATLTASATSGVFGISRTAGTSLQLIGEATSSSAATDKAVWEFSLPPSYAAATDIPVLVNCIVTGTGTLTAVSTTVTVAAYTEINGVETALTVSAAQQFGKTQRTLTFTITGAGSGLAPESHVVLEVVMLVTTASGAGTGFINSVAYQASSFAPTPGTAQSRYLSLTSARADTGAVLTATATGGAMGIARTAGTSLALVGEATSSSGVTDKAMFEFNLPDTYIANANVPVLVNCIVTGSGTLTAITSTMTVAAYATSAGVETALTVSAAQQFNKTAGTLTFTITGSGLTPLAHVVLELVMLVTTSAGACTGQVNSVAYSA